MINCQEFADFLSDYLSGEVSDRERKVFDTHMDLCPPCRDYLKTFEKTVEMGKMVCSAEDSAVPNEAPEDLVQAILAARPKPKNDPEPPA